jgi:hypothetical protein
MPIVQKLKNSWNAFKSSEEDLPKSHTYGPSANYNPQRPRLTYYNERSIVSSLYTRLSMDIAGIQIRHVKIDTFDRYSEDIKSALNTCFRLTPNLDQGPRAFRQDIAMTLFDKGVAAIVPVDMVMDNSNASINDIYTLRVGEVIEWFPKHVRVRLYNEEKGTRQDVVLEKQFVAIVENPLYSVMNEPSSTLQRLTRKLQLLDVVDEQSSSGKLDLIIQLPYVIKSEARRSQAEARRSEIEFQLKGSQYGIAYTDGTEKITQLNRPAENNLLKQVEFLTNMLYSQLGITAEVMNGTADEKTMTNYYTRTVEPILDAIVESMQKTFLGISGTQKNQSIRYFRDPFKLVPISQIAEIADKFSRNEILTPNEVRSFIGMAPSAEPKANQLQNSNMPQAPAGSPQPSGPSGPSFEDMDSVVNDVFDGLTNSLDDMIKETSK